MWYLYLDESGDLGFDFKNKRPSKYFTITILCFQGTDLKNKLGYAAKKTLARKLNPKKHRKCIIEELKGAHTKLDIKKYLFNQIRDIDFSIYAVTLDKKRTLQYANDNKARLYNYVAKLVLDQIPLENIDSSGIEFIIDRSKGKKEIVRFNSYIRQNLQSKIAPKTPLTILHENSRDDKCIQIVDLFCWGIFQKYENTRTDWLDIFKDKVLKENLYQG
ncbi:MAG: DUF3800 domain-containing protein [Candidatus Margulisbacteria bacterium]|jgi:hypothetical protein|nr:DUF3800 domain-containing protein [Candidatus Margulisiibacteriota bacterium]